MKKYKHQELFPREEEIWEKEWHGMPEFISEEKKPFKEIKVKFESPEDYKEFMHLIDLPLSMKTLYVWYPFYQKGSRREWRYVNEEE